MAPRNSLAGGALFWAINRHLFDYYVGVGVFSRFSRAKPTPVCRRRFYDKEYAGPRASSPRRWPLLKGETFHSFDRENMVGGVHCVPDT